MNNPYFSDEFIKEMNESIKRINDAFCEAGKALGEIFQSFPSWMLEKPRRKELYERRYNRRKRSRHK